MRAFKVAHVFDVSQTDGEALADVRPVLLEGEAPARLWDALAAQVQGAGYDLARDDPDDPGANGATAHGARRVLVRPDLAPAQAAKTLAHELAHVLLGHGAAGAPVVGRERAEVEAESVAFVVCAAAGLAAGAYSWPYVARWAGGDLAVVRGSAERVVRCARCVLDAIEAEPAAEPAEVLA